jgi:hypothetical protein
VLESPRLQVEVQALKIFTNMSLAGGEVEGLEYSIKVTPQPSTPVAVRNTNGPNANATLKIEI